MPHDRSYSPSDRQIESVFNEAMDLPSEARQAYLDEACGDEVDLRKKVETLLQSESELSQEGFLDDPTVEPEKTKPVGAW